MSAWSIPLFPMRHVTAIRVISIMLLLSGVIAFVVYPSVLQFSRALTMEGFARQMELRFAWLRFSAGMAIVSGWGGALAGLLPIFQRGLTRRKKVVLLALCVLPMLFVVLNSASVSSELGWRVARTGIGLSMPCWIVNGPAILTGQPILKSLQRILCRLRLASGDLPD